jgi:multiple sugar transport system permease protein
MRRRLIRTLPWIAIGFILLVCYPWPLGSRPSADGSAAVEEIRFMYPKGSLTGALERVIREFEEECRREHARDPARPLYRVVAGQHGERGGSTRFLLAVAGGSPPDVFYGDRAATADWIARGAFMQLDDFIAEDRRQGREDAPRPARYYPGCWASVTFNGRVYGVPLGMGNIALFYNKDLLEGAGFVHEDGPQRGEARPPRTWGEVRDYCRRLTRWEDVPPRQPALIGFAPLQGAGSLELYTHLAGGQLIDPAGRVCQLDGEPARKALQFITDLYEAQGGIAAVRAMNFGPAGSPFDPFIQGRLAMKIDYQWAVKWQAEIKPDMRFGVAPLPTAAPVDGPTSWATGWQASIPVGARNPRAGWALIRFLGSDRGLELMAEHQRRLTEANGKLFVPGQSPIPALNERLTDRYVRDNPRLPPDIRRAHADFQRLLPVSDYPPNTPVYNLMATAQSEAAERALYGRSPAESLSEQSRIVQAELDRCLAPRGPPLPGAGWLVLGYAGLMAVGAFTAFRFDSGRAFGRGWRRSERRWGILFAAPWLLGFAVFTGGPLLFSLLLSFCDYDVLREPTWVGLENYRELLTEDLAARRALANTLTMALAVPPCLAISLGLALLVHQAVRFRAAWRGTYYLPVVVPLVASSLAWLWFLSARGPLNQALGWFGLSGPNWLHEPAWSKPALILMMIWTCGASMIVWLAGLQTVPRSLYEAAALDGANAWQRFRHVTWPHLAPFFFFNLLTGLIMAFQSFGEAFIMTAGGPDQSTLFLNYHLFNLAFQSGRMGYASALAWMLFLLLVGVAALQFRLVNRGVRGDGGKA